MYISFKNNHVLWVDLYSESTNVLTSELLIFQGTFKKWLIKIYPQITSAVNKS